MASDYDLVLANFKMKLEAGCCSKSIRIRFDLDKLKEQDIESGVPDSDWRKVRSPDFDYERNCGPMRREARTEGLRHPDDEAMSSSNIAQRGQEEDEINQRELDIGAV